MKTPKPTVCLCLLMFDAIILIVNIVSHFLFLTINQFRALAERADSVTTAITIVITIYY